MNEDFTHIIEQALQYVSSQPVPPIDSTPSFTDGSLSCTDSSPGFPDSSPSFLNSEHVEEVSDQTEICVESFSMELDGSCCDNNKQFVTERDTFISHPSDNTPTESNSTDSVDTYNFSSALMDCSIHDSPNSNKQSVDSTEVNGTKLKVKRRRRREKNPDPAPEPVLPPCSICDEKSSGYHYGVNTCEACKGFYRRTLKKKEVDYKCKCQPEERESWKRGPFKNGCPACRYERCLAVGMSKNAIKIGRYTLNHKTKNIKQVKTLEAIDSFIETSLRGHEISCSPQSQQTLEATMCALDEVSSTTTVNEADINASPCTSTLDETDRSTDMTPSTKSNSFPPAVNKDIYPLSLKEIDSIVKTLTDAEPDISKVYENTDKIEEEQAACSERYNLKMEIFGDIGFLSHAEFREFYRVTGMDIDGRLNTVNEALKYFESKITNLVSFAKSIPGFRELCLDDQVKLIKASRAESSLVRCYKMVESRVNRDLQVITAPWGKTFHLSEVKHLIPQRIFSTRWKLAERLHKLNLFPQEQTVLRAIVTTFADRCDLAEPQKVEKIQNKLLCCLQHLLNIRPGGPQQLFQKICTIMTDLRTLTEYRNEFSNRIFDEMPMIEKDKYKLVDELIS